MLEHPYCAAVSVDKALAAVAEEIKSVFFDALHFDFQNLHLDQLIGDDLLKGDLEKNLEWVNFNPRGKSDELVVCFYFAMFKDD